MLAPLVLTSLLAFAEPPAQGPTTSDRVALVRLIHGAAGPWAVAGYRIGERALAELELPRHSPSLLVVHRCPARVPYSCLADGLQAATGASPGKLNLRVEEGPVDRLSTTVEDRKTGRRLTFTLRPEFVRSIRDVPRERLEEEGRRVATLADGDLFQLIIDDPDRGRLPPPRGAWERGGNHPRAVPPPPVSD